MLEEKIADLASQKQKKLLQRLVGELSKSNPELYYQATSEVARALKLHIDGEAKLFQEERELLQVLSQRDIEVLLSHHS